MQIELTPKEAFDLWRSLPDGTIKDKLTAALASEDIFDNAPVRIEFSEKGPRAKWRSITVPSSSIVRGLMNGHHIPNNTDWRYAE